MKFVVDSMLGRLATWLRVLGYDTHYESHYSKGELADLMRQDRRLVTRNRTKLNLSPEAVFLHSDHVEEQLEELFVRLDLDPDPSRWFTRCLRCNTVLEAAGNEEAMEKVPEYVFYESRGKIRVCRGCGRYFWPGSHRKRMLKQLNAWGLRDGNQL
jgi:uncharacterized protein with PIN domain